MGAVCLSVLVAQPESSTCSFCEEIGFTTGIIYYNIIIGIIWPKNYSLISAPDS